jgi:site-specific recombinase XerD
LTADIVDESDIQWESVLDEYLNFLHGCGRSKSTICIYSDHISRFYREKNPVWDAEKEHFLEWNGEPQIHTNHRLDSCKRFWEWGIRTGHRKTNPAEGTLRRMVNRNPVANVNLSDIEKLVEVFKAEYRERPKQWECLRNYAYVMFSIGTGVRPGEGLRLQRHDFNLSERLVMVRAEYVKTRQSRVIYIPQNAALNRLLQKMIKVQSKVGVPSDAPLFSDSAGKQISSRSWFHIVQKRAKQTDVRVKPYDFRHAFITHSLADGANPYDLRDQVGHSNMEMMKRYYHSSAEARRHTTDLAPLRKISKK